MVELDEFPETTDLLLLVLQEHDGVATTSDLNGAIPDEDLDLDAINYRIRRLAEAGMVEARQQGTDEDGRHLPKKILLTDEGEDLAGVAAEQLQYRVEISDGRVERSDGEVAALREEAAELRERLDKAERKIELLNETSPQTGEVSRMIDEWHQEYDRVDALEADLDELAADVESLESYAEGVWSHHQQLRAFVVANVEALGEAVDGYSPVETDDFLDS